jgi:hypothetical protein
MKVWYRGGALAGGALLLASSHIGAQIREGVAGARMPRAESGVVERRGHPEVLLNTRAPEFEGGERVVVQIMLKQLDPKAAVGKVPPPAGVDGLIAYPGSRLLMVRGTKEAVAGYRASLEKLDREAEGGKPVDGAALGMSPEIRVPVTEKLALKAERVTQEGAMSRATGHVVLGLGNGIELRAQQVRITTVGGQRRIIIEK